MDIINSLEIRYEDGPDGITIDEGYLAKKQEQCTAFPYYALLQLGTWDRQDFEPCVSVQTSKSSQSWTQSDGTPLAHP